MADRIELSNDTVGGGVHSDEASYFFFPQVNITSVATTSVVVLQPAFVAKANGRITDAWCAVAQQAVSASGFVSGTTILAAVRINSGANILATNPQVNMTGTSAAVATVATNQAGGTSAVVTAASANFSAGDIVTFDWTLNSTGSAAAGRAMAGSVFGLTVRYAAI